MSFHTKSSQRGSFFGGRGMGAYAALVSLLAVTNCTSASKGDGTDDSGAGGGNDGAVSSTDSGSNASNDASRDGAIGSADVVDGSGNVVPDAYREMAAQLSGEPGIAYRYGPSYESYHSTPETFPTWHQRPDIIVPGYNDIQMVGNVGGPYTQESGDWYITASNSAFLPDDPAQHFGVNQFLSSSETKNVFFSQPQPFPPYADSGFNDPSGVELRQAGVDYAKPIAMARCNGHPGWCLVGTAVFQNGLIATARGGNTSLNKAMTQLPAGKVPSAIAQTNSSEFALVTIWDTVNLKGQLAVVAIGAMCNGCQPDVPDTNDEGWGEWGPNHPGLANRGNINFLKIVGYIDLPDLHAPTELAATTAWDPWSSRIKTADGTQYSSNYRMPLEDEVSRQTYVTGVNAEYVTKAGIAVVISKS